MALAGIHVEDLAEIIEAMYDCTTSPGIGQIQQWPILIVTSEIIGVSWNVVAQAPGTCMIFPVGHVVGATAQRILNVADTKEGIEVGRRPIIRRWNQGAASSCCAIAGSFNTWQISLKCRTVVIRIKEEPGQRTGEANCRWMQSRIAIGPGCLIGRAIEARIGTLTARDLD